MSSLVDGLTRTDELAAAVPFQNGAEHLLACIEVLKQQLHLEVIRLRARRLLVESDFRGLYISDEHVDALLQETPDTSLSARAEALVAEIKDRQTHIAACLKASDEAGISLPLVRLTRIFDLTSFEQQVLIACAAPEVDLRLESLYSYVQNDVNRKRPTTDLLSKLFGQRRGDLPMQRAAFSHDAKLMRNGLITRLEDAQQRESSMLACAWRTDEHITDYLLDGNGIDPRLRPFAQLSFHVQGRLLLPSGLARQLANAISPQGGTVIVLCGPSGSGKRSVAEALTAMEGRPLIVADLAGALLSALPLQETLRLLIRETSLQGANLFLANGQALLAEKAQSPQHLAMLERGLEGAGRNVFIGAQAHPADFKLQRRSALHVFELPVPLFEHRVHFWEMAIGKSQLPAPGVDTAALANKFVLTGGRIYAACQSAAASARLRAPERPSLLTPDLESAARAQSNQTIGKLAQKISTEQSWRDLILPPRALQQLRAAAAAYKFRHIVYSQWDFGKRLAMGKGLNVLFWGPSGTGKTLAAGVLANELGLDMYKIDLSSVVSKYIGETEKQLSMLFREAQTSNAILFFDEADALFGKRSEVKDAHDRYANIETAYLLQKMEEYEGIVILTTNFRKNIDDAFARRMHHVVEFSFPDAALRLQIWKALIPEAAKLDPGVDFGFLARQFELTGGNVRNVVLAAAFLAAEEGASICMLHLILATARELQKLGKLPARSDFRDYFDMIHGRV